MSLEHVLRIAEGGLRDDANIVLRGVMRLERCGGGRYIAEELKGEVKERGGRSRSSIAE
jgi:hypothetical protein